MKQTSKHVKVLFEIPGPDGSCEVESLWALPTDRGYRIDNIPFYAKEVAYNDIVAAVADESGALCFQHLVEAAGHSTVRLWFARDADVQGVRDTLRQLGCASELDLARLVAVDVPPSVPYSEIRRYLDVQEAARVFEYQEACLGQD